VQVDGRRRGRSGATGQCRFELVQLRAGAIALDNALGRICAGFRTSFRVMGGVENQASMSPQFRGPRLENGAALAVRENLTIRSELFIR